MVYPYGSIKLNNDKDLRFKVNGQRMKLYLKEVDGVKTVCDMALGKF